MLKQIISWDDDAPRAPEGVRISSIVLALYVALLPISTGLTGLVSGISPLNYIAVLYFLSFLVELLRHPAPLFKKDLLYVYVYFSFALLSFLWRSEKSFDWELTTFLTSALMFLSASARRYSEKELKLFVAAVMLSIAVVFAVTAANFPTRSIRMQVRVVQRIDPNEFGCGLCVAIGMIMTMSLQKKNWWMILILALLFMVVILSSSRGAMLMAAVMTVCWIVAAAAKKRILIPLIPIILVTAIFLVVVVYYPMYFNLRPKTIRFIVRRLNLMTLFQDGGAGRVNIWRSAFDAFFASSPLRMIFGYGHGSFADVVNHVTQGRDFAFEAHNMYINALIENGVIGLILLLLAFVQLFLYSVRNRNLWGTLALIGFAMEGVSLHAQVFRVFGWAFVVAAIYKGGCGFEVLFSPDGDGDRPRLQS